MDDILKFITSECGALTIASVVAVIVIWRQYVKVNGALVNALKDATDLLHGRVKDRT